jgi:hypothetical protein
VDGSVFFKWWRMGLIEKSAYEGGSGQCEVLRVGAKLKVNKAEIALLSVINAVLGQQVIHVVTHTVAKVVA